jgi:WD40 repeat protein
MRWNLFLFFSCLTFTTGCQLVSVPILALSGDKPDPNAWTTHGRDAETWEPAVASLAYSPDGERLVTGSTSRTQGFFDTSRRSSLFWQPPAIFALWDASDSQRIAQRSRTSIAGGSAARVSVSSNSEIFAARHLHGVDFRRTEDGALIKRLDAPKDLSGYQSVVSPDCRFVVWSQSTQDEQTSRDLHDILADSESEPSDSTKNEVIHEKIEFASIFIQSVETEKIIRTLPQMSANVSAETFSPDGRFLAIVLSEEEDFNWTLQVIDLQTGSISLEIPVLDQYYCLSRRVLFSRDGSTIALLTTAHDAAGEKQPVIATWNVKLGKEIAKWAVGADRMVWDLTFSADGRQIIGGIEVEDKLESRQEVSVWESRPEVRVWETTTGRTVASWFHQDAFDDKIPSWGITAVAVSPDGKTLAAGTSNGSIRFYNVPDR